MFNISTTFFLRKLHLKWKLLIFWPKKNMMASVRLHRYKNIKRFKLKTDSIFYY